MITRIKNKSHPLRRILTALLILIIVWFLFDGLTRQMRQSVIDSQVESIRNAVTRSMINYYATNGYYPEDLKEIQTHYGIEWDEDRYLVNYEVIGSNLKPDVSVFLK